MLTTRQGKAGITNDKKVIRGQNNFQTKNYSFYSEKLRLTMTAGERESGRRGGGGGLLEKRGGGGATLAVLMGSER